MALALLFLLAQLAAFLHLATERHEVCADHGELVHASAQAAGHEHASDAQAEHEDGVADRSGPRLDPDDGAPSGAHAHCGSLPVLDPRQRAPEELRVEPAPLLAAQVPAGRPSAAHVSVPLLLRAPKQSPPA